MSAGNVGSEHGSPGDAETTFGECEGCFNQVERVGWDRLCSSCQDEEREEQAERWQRMHEEDLALYTLPWGPARGRSNAGES